jgi:hypothetical protein
MYYKCKTSAQLQVTLGGPTLSWSCTLVVFLAFPLSDRLLEFTFIALLHEGERERERELKFGRKSMHRTLEKLN